jgi:hypothetical protein
LASDDYALERSPYSRRIAEKALLTLVQSLGGYDLPLVVLGGLVPEVLTGGQEPPVPQHLGTTDVDVHIDLELDLAIDLGPLEAALLQAGFEPDPTNLEGWRWRGVVDGMVVKVEFLCDLQEKPANTIVRPHGCHKLRALNLRGTGFVAHDFELVEIGAQLGNGREHTARVRFAGLEGYLMSKAYAARHRGLEKDYYDLAYILLYNKLGGPSEVAAALARGKFRARVNLALGPWSELGARFRRPENIGPASYATQARQAGDTTDESTLRQDAVGAVREFLDSLEVTMGTSPDDADPY